LGWGWKIQRREEEEEEVSGDGCAKLPAWNGLERQRMNE